ncbi:MAG: endo-1,4-beta-xylanase [Chitinophagales bacterium]
MRANFLHKYLLFFSVFILFFSCTKEDDDTGGEPIVELNPPTSVNISTIGQTSFRLDWSSVAGADAYEATVALDNGFTDLVAPYVDLRENGTGINVISLTPNTTYYVRVRTVIGTEKSAYSSTSNATTLDANAPEPNSPLKDAAQTFAVGMAVSTSKLGGQYDAIYKKEFNSLTAEYEMKMNVMYPSQGNYDFSKSDAIVNYAVENGMHVHGHALIWHSATPNWVDNFGGTDAEFEAMVKEYIQTTVTRYAGQVRSWDVVNEAFQDGNGNLRNSVFLQRMGPDYIEKCYKWTREADPDVLIFYNDYNMVTDATKRNAALDMVDDFLAKNVPIDGFGFQMHISYNGPSKNQIASASQEVVNRGLLLHFSELDVRANPNNNLTFLTEARSVEQQAKVREVVEVYNAIPAANKFTLTIWGLKDNESWLLNFWGHIDWPLFYDDQFQIKKAHTGFLEGLN